MERVATVRVDFLSILDLPEGPKRASLARKALALMVGEPDTKFLEQLNAIATDEQAVNALFQVTSFENSSMQIPTDVEPTDHADGTKHAMSIVDFARSTDAADLDKARWLKKQIRRLIREHEWQDAAYLAVSGLFDLKGNRRRGMVKLLAKVARHHVVARLHYGKALVRGDAVRADVDKGIRLLEEVTGDDDPVHAGYAHFVIGETLMTVPGMGYRALRNFESAAYLGWEDASDYAGVLCLLGENGVPKDVLRAVKNFKYGILKGQVSCMSKYVVLVLRGDAPFDPDWRNIHRMAVEAQESLAMTVDEELEVAASISEGDDAIFLEEARTRMGTKVGMHVESRLSEMHYVDDAPPT